MDDSDRLFAKLVVEQGLADDAQVQECLAVLDTLEASGVRPLPRLGELLVRKGYLTAAQADATMRRGGSLPAAPAGDLPAGQRIGKYVKVSCLGSGGFGEVWKAWDVELRRWVALKFLKYNEPDEVSRFRREAQTAAQLNHPNVAAVYEATDAFIAMQFVEGSTLSTFPRNDRRLLAQLLRDAARGVHHAHEHGIVHRDLKPDNLMVDASRRLYVMDFGLAKRTAVASSLSVSGTVVGTPAYMSPEQARGELPRIDARSDVYSLGATLYEVLTDIAPFRGKDVYDTIRRVIETEPKPLRALNPQLDCDLETIVMKCLEKDPARRYPTSAALADDLTRYLEGEAIEAHPPSTLYRIRKWTARHRAVVIPSVAAVVLALALAGWLSWSAFLRSRDLGSALEAGRNHEAREDYAKACEAYSVALQIDPRNAEANAGYDRSVARLREISAGQERKRVEAESRRREIELFAPIEKELALLRMNFYKKVYSLNEDELAKYEKLEERVQEQMKESGESAAGWYLIGRCREVSARWRAEDAYDRALSFEKRHGPSLLRKGRFYLERALLERGAVVSGDQLVRTDFHARSGEMWIRMGLEGAEGIEADLARAYVEVVKNFEKGTYSAERDVARWAGEPLVEEFLLLQAIGRASLEETIAIADRAPSYPEAWFWIGVGQRTRRNLAGAIDGFSRAVRIHPRFAWGFLGRGNGHAESGDLESALADFNRVVELDPRNPRGWNNRGVVHWRMGRLDEAHLDFERALEISPEGIDALLNRGLVHQARNRPDRALADFDHAIRVEPDRAELRIARGTLRFDLGRVDEALEDIEHALRLRPKSAAAWTYRGLIHVAKREGREALEAYGRAIEADPKYALAYANRACLLRDADQGDLALRDFDRAIELEPKRAATWSERASLHQARGRIDLALRDYDESLRLRPHEARTWYNRGTAHHKRKDRDAAFRDYEEALKLDPDLYPALANRGLIHWDRGELDAAIDDFERALAASPESWPGRGTTAKWLDQAKAEKARKP